MAAVTLARPCVRKKTPAAARPAITNATRMAILRLIFLHRLPEKPFGPYSPASASLTSATRRAARPC